MIAIGINQGVVLATAKISDKGSLELHLVEAKTIGEKKSIFEEANSAKVSSDTKTTQLLIFPFKKPTGTRNDGKTDDELIEMISQDMAQTKNKLTQLLEQYLKSDDIKWDAYKQTGVTAENHRKLLLQNDTLESVFHNYATQFIDMATPFFNKPEFALRMKLVRQSAEKNYMTIPSRYLDEMPWVELMDVPEKNSRVKFSQWEIDNGYNSSAAVSKKDTDTKEEIADTPEAKKSAFGQR